MISALDLFCKDIIFVPILIREQKEEVDFWMILSLGDFYCATKKLNKLQTQPRKQKKIS